VECAASMSDQLQRTHLSALIIYSFLTLSLTIYDVLAMLILPFMGWCV